MYITFHSDLDMSNKIVVLFALYKTRKKLQFVIPIHLFMKFNTDAKTHVYLIA